MYLHVLVVTITPGYIHLSILFKVCVHGSTDPEYDPPPSYILMIGMIRILKQELRNGIYHNIGGSMRFCIDAEHTEVHGKVCPLCFKLINHVEFEVCM